MRPSSSSSDGLFGGIFGRGPVAAQVSDAAWLQAMLDVEAALVEALARVGLTTGAVAEIVAGCCRVEFYDLDELARAAADSGNPVVPLVTALTRQVGETGRDDAAGQVHRGATSQDILDTATMLMAQRALGPMLAELAVVASRCAALAAEHAQSMMIGRTLLQPAQPTTFGLKAAGWLTSIDRARLQLFSLREDVLAVQLGGGAGTLASLGADGPEVVRVLADVLGLAEPVVPWHTDRTRVVALVAALATSIGVLGKIGRDVTLLAQAEVGEVREASGPGRGGSSTMPHKRNPVAAVTLVACATRAPGLLSTVAGAMPQEHERSAGLWQAEWEAVRDLLRLAGASAAWARDLLEGGLQVDTERMRSNLRLAGPFPMAENVTTALTPTVGRAAAHRVVEAACRRAKSDHVSLQDALLDAPEAAALGRDVIEQALDPATSVVAVPELVRRALAAHKAVEARLCGVT